MCDDSDIVDVESYILQKNAGCYDRIVKPTIFENVWNSDTLFLYKNERAGVGAIPDALPKFPDQIVIIPAKGFPDRDEASLYNLPLSTQMAMTAVQVVFQEKMESFSGVPGVRSIIRGDGFAVPNHPHIVMFPALRGESTAYTEPTRPSFTEPEVREKLIRNTLQNLALTAEERSKLDDMIAGIVDF